MEQETFKKELLLKGLSSVDYKGLTTEQKRIYNGIKTAQKRVRVYGRFIKPQVERKIKKLLKDKVDVFNPTKSQKKKINYLASHELKYSVNMDKLISMCEEYNVYINNKPIDSINAKRFFSDVYQVLKNKGAALVLVTTYIIATENKLFVELPDVKNIAK
jgi:hypothetical protein